MLKWPNDVMLLGRKLAGILLERSGDRVAVGFGANLATAPHLPDRQCASLAGKVLPDALAPLLARSFARLLRLWRTGRLDLEGMISVRSGLDGINEAFRAMKAGEVIRTVIEF